MPPCWSQLDRSAGCDRKDQRAACYFPAIASGHHFGARFAASCRGACCWKRSICWTAQVSGTIRDVPIKWADVRREVKTFEKQGRWL
jgi:hypothetical protein